MSMLVYKIWHDLWNDRARTIQVVLIIAMGVFGIGLIIGGRNLNDRMLSEDWQKASPPQIQLSVNPPVSDELLNTMSRRIDGIADAEGLLTASLEWRLGPEDEWKNAFVRSRADFENQIMYQYALVDGDWPARSRVAIASGFGEALDLPADARLELRSGDITRRVQVGGEIYTLGVSPAFVSDLQLYVSRDLFEDLTGRRDYNIIQTRDVTFDQARAEATDQEIIAFLDKQGIETSGAFQPLGNRISPPEANPIQDVLKAMFAVLTVVGGMIIVLSLFLVYNTVSAIITQQVNQIGVMKAIGARTSQILWSYLLLVFTYGFLASLIAIPLGILAAHGLKTFFAQLVNVYDNQFKVDPTAVTLQLTVALLAPLFASLGPLLGGARITVREAINTYGLSGEVSWVDRWVSRVGLFSYSFLLTIGNTFRNTKRVAFTLITLAGAGLIFMMVIGVSDSTQYTFKDELFAIHRYQVSLSFEQPQRMGQVRNIALKTPGVEAVELWTVAPATIRPEYQTEASEQDESVNMFGQPLDTAMYAPRLTAGRWIRESDRYGLVINEMLAQSIGVGVGDRVILQTQDEKERAWMVVGMLYDPVMNNSVHMDQELIARELGQGGQANTLWARTTNNGPEVAVIAAEDLERNFTDRGLDLARRSVFFGATIYEISDQQLLIFNIVLSLLSILAVVIAVVGGLGLSGVLTLSVLERRREIGVMRAIGASSRRIVQLFVGEGMVLSTMSWLIALPLSIPLAYVLSTQVLSSIFTNVIVYQFTLRGPLLWLTIISILAVIASFLPARKAARVSVRESLMYE